MAELDLSAQLQDHALKIVALSGRVDGVDTKVDMLSKRSDALEVKLEAVLSENKDQSAKLDAIHAEQIRRNTMIMEKLMPYILTILAGVTAWMAAHGMH